MCTGPIASNSGFKSDVSASGNVENIRLAGGMKPPLMVISDAMLGHRIVPYGLQRNVPCGLQTWKLLFLTGLSWPS